MARGHATSYSARVDCEMLSVTKHRIQIYRRKGMVWGNAQILPHRAGCVTELFRELVTEIAAKKGRNEKTETVR